MNITFDLPVIILVEDNVFICYCEKYDISGYGNTESEAVDSFKTVLHEILISY